MSKLWPISSKSDEKGLVTFELSNQQLKSITNLMVKPNCDFWSISINSPNLSSKEINIINLKSFKESFRGFPNVQLVGWGIDSMNINKLPQEYNGKGIKIAIVDSGAATTHKDLANQAKAGFDIVNNNKANWNIDLIGHGSHCAGVIAGDSNNKYGITGIAPEAEIHILKIFPNGQFSSLISALDYCIEKDIDVVNLSLGSAKFSDLVERKILEAKEKGIACIVAAGNSAGPVQYPARSKNVLAVAALGKEGTFPDDSYQATLKHVDENATIDNGYFSASFTCHGNEIDVCAPGVAIISSVPPNNFDIKDGTSMAAPHVTGLAALILAHHPEFLNQNSTRNATRVERLFQIIKKNTINLDLGDLSRTGSGMPDALKIFDSKDLKSSDIPNNLLKLKSLMMQCGLSSGKKELFIPLGENFLLREIYRNSHLFSIKNGYCFLKTEVLNMSNLRSVMQASGLK